MTGPVVTIRAEGSQRLCKRCEEILSSTGCVFEGGETAAPFYRLPGGTRLQMTIDHIVGRQTAPGSALDAANLRLSSRRENTVLLHQITAQDPFQRVP